MWGGVNFAMDFAVDWLSILGGGGRVRGEEWVVLIPPIP